MLAFLIAQQSWRNGGDAFDDISPSILSVAGRPFIEHQIKNLAMIGVKRLRISGGIYTSKIEGILGDGKKWGIDISYIVCAEGKPWDQIFILNKSFFSSSENYLLLRGNVLFPVDTKIDGEQGILYSVSLDDFLSVFSCSSGALYLPANEMAIFRKAGILNFIEDVHAFIADTHSSMLRINDLILSNKDKWWNPDFPKSFNQVYIADSAKIASSAKLSSACVIGEKCRIEQDVVIGGNVSIGEGCIIDQGALLTECIVDANTYIGKFATVDSSIISGHRIYSRNTDSCAYVPDGFWVDSLKEKEGKFSEDVSFGERFFALLFFILSYFLLFIYGCSRKKYRAMFSIAEQGDLDGHFTPGEFEYKMDKSLPPAKAVLSSLPEVIKGKMHLCGRIPLSREQLNLIPHDFLEIYLSSRPGIVTLPDNLLCENCFQRKIQDIYLCGSLGFLKRLLLFLESYRILKHSKLAAGYLSEAGLNNATRKEVE